MTRAIASRELADSTQREQPITIYLNTDNKGNAFTLQKEYARKWPSSAMLMEHALWCHLTRIHPEVVHVRRESNQWADALANGKTEGFDKDKEMQLPDQRWLVWEELLSVAKNK